MESSSSRLNKGDEAGTKMLLYCKNCNVLIDELTRQMTAFETLASFNSIMSTDLLLQTLRGVIAKFQAGSLVGLDFNSNCENSSSQPLIQPQDGTGRCLGQSQGQGQCLSKSQGLPSTFDQLPPPAANNLPETTQQDEVQVVKVDDSSLGQSVMSPPSSVRSNLSKKRLPNKSKSKSSKAKDAAQPSVEVDDSALGQSAVSPPSSVRSKSPKKRLSNKSNSKANKSKYVVQPSVEVDDSALGQCIISPPSSVRSNSPKKRLSNVSKSKKSKEAAQPPVLRGVAKKTSTKNQENSQDDPVNVSKPIRQPRKRAKKNLPTENTKIDEQTQTPAATPAIDLLNSGAKVKPSPSTSNCDLNKTDDNDYSSLRSQLWERTTRRSNYCSILDESSIDMILSASDDDDVNSDEIDLNNDLGHADPVDTMTNGQDNRESMNEPNKTKDQSCPKSKRTNIKGKDNPKPGTKSTKVQSKDKPKPKSVKVKVKDNLKPKSIEIESKDDPNSELIKISNKDDPKSESTKIIGKDARKPKSTKVKGKNNPNPKLIKKRGKVDPKSKSIKKQGKDKSTKIKLWGSKNLQKLQAKKGNKGKIGNTKSGYSRLAGEMCKPLTWEKMAEANKHLVRKNVRRAGGGSCNYFQCTICKKTLTTITNARLHVRRVHFQERLPCPYAALGCTQKFYDFKLVRAHRYYKCPFRPKEGASDNLPLHYNRWAAGQTLSSQSEASSSLSSAPINCDSNRPPPLPPILSSSSSLPAPRASVDPKTVRKIKDSRTKNCRDGPNRPLQNIKIITRAKVTKSKAKRHVKARPGSQEKKKPHDDSVVTDFVDPHSRPVEKVVVRNPFPKFDLESTLQAIVLVKRLAVENVPKPKPKPSPLLKKKQQRNTNSNAGEKANENPNPTGIKRIVKTTRPKVKAKPLNFGQKKIQPQLDLIRLPMIKKSPPSGVNGNGNSEVSPPLLFKIKTENEEEQPLSNSSLEQDFDGHHDIAPKLSPNISNEGQSQGQSTVSEFGGQISNQVDRQMDLNLVSLLSVEMDTGGNEGRNGGSNENGGETEGGVEDALKIPVVVPRQDEGPIFTPEMVLEYVTPEEFEQAVITDDHNGGDENLGKKRSTSPDICNFSQK